MMMIDVFSRAELVK